MVTPDPNFDSIHQRSAPRNRQARILEMVRDQGYCLTAELAAAFSVSEMTIRRDIARLERIADIRSVRGGVTTLPTAALSGSDFRTRASRRAAAKKAIARAAVDFIPDSGLIAIDAGTTTLEICDLLPSDRNFKVISNSLPAVNALAKRSNVDLMVLGGSFNESSQSFTGPVTIRSLEDMNVGTLFLGASLVSERGVFCGTDFDAVTKRAYIDAADEVILLCDSSKFYVTAMARVAQLDLIDRIIVDDALTDDQVKMLQLQGVSVTTVSVVAEKEPV